jgi:glycosyltransferase involved in cell wall biosynthesis
MKIGFVSTSFPVDLETNVYGGFKRMGMFIEALKEMGELDMLFYVHPQMDITSQYIAEMEEKLARHWDAKLHLDLCNLAPYKQANGRWQEYITPALSMTDHPPYRQSAQREQISAVHRMLSRKPDILFIHRLAGMTPFLLSKEHHPRLFFDLDDIEHVAYSRSIKHPPVWPGKLLYYLRVPILKQWERRAIRSSYNTFVCSEHDQRYLSHAYGCTNVKVVPNAIEIPEAQGLTNQPILLFLGRMSYPPNTVAADYLIKAIWPIIHAALPDARLLIAGAKPENIDSFSERPPGVDFLGFIDDLKKLYAQIAVVCCPILSGGGTRIKILEAAAFGKPVVSTTIGAEGIDFRDGDEILLRDDPASFAEGCLKLLKDRSLAAGIGQAARTSVARHYDRKNVVKRIRAYLTEPDRTETRRLSVDSTR